MRRSNNRNFHLIYVACGICLMSGLLCGCSKRPRGIISEKKMVRLIADMQLAEAYSNMSDEYMRHPDGKGELGKAVLEAHGISQEQLDTTLSWYGHNLDDYTELYEKVDKEILKRKRKLLDLSNEDMSRQDESNLWEYGNHSMISGLGINDGLILSINNPEIQRGDRLQWSMRVNSPVQFNGVLGVEYEDGTSEAMTTNFTGRDRLEIFCQTDTGKTVRRVYGTMRMRENAVYPIFADSIRIISIPYDSLEYHNHRGNRHYGIPVPIKPVRHEDKDSIGSEKQEKSVDGKERTKEEDDKPLMWNASGSGNLKDRPVAPGRTLPSKRRPTPPDRKSPPGRPIPPERR